MPDKTAWVFLGVCLVAAGCRDHGSRKGQVAMEAGTDYPVYGGNKAGNRYSPLRQIDTTNVKDLQIAWTYDAREKQDTGNPVRQRPREIQCQPIVVNGVLYGTNSKLAVFALNAGTGEQLWKFEPIQERQRFNTNRGVAYWENGDDKRILYTAGAWLYALDARTGKPINGFGNGGKVDLHEGLGAGLHHDVNTLSVTATTPGVVYKNVLVLGSSVSESGDAAPGHVRGFDIVSGRLLWTFHTVPQPGEAGYDTWPKDAYEKIGAANNWGGLAVDEKRGAVYFGTGSPASDFYGGDRAGTNLFANCVVSLDAETGKLKWYFQTIRHDLWDRDIPCPPNLATVSHNGRNVDVVIQATKDGLVYVLDRDSGISLFPIEERPVPVAGLPGEHPWPTQIFPLKPLPLCRQSLTEEDLTDISPESHAFAKERFDKTPQPNTKFMPPNEGGTLLIGYSGGAEWGGNAVDPEGVLYQNANEDAWDLQMVDVTVLNKELASFSHGNLVYAKNCSFCHGMDRKGSGSQFPNLLNIGARRSATEINAIVKTGAGRMPSFAYLSDDDRNALVGFLLNTEDKKKTAKIASEHSNDMDTAVKKKGEFPYEPRYISKVWRKFTDQDGYNAVKPPWGTLNAIDLNTGDYLWRVPLGEFPELTKKGIPITGTQSYGGPVVTAGGLLFIAGTRDEKIRAFNRKTGKVVWEYQLPAGAFATPITYEKDGKQYVVIAAGGAKEGSKPGGWYVAFTLK
ncbi:MAG: PQQ-binding-like beta-propeller repeat protein [Puia sp.]|nr:PQQ-binding-like beta-propeller repeat protein [Puia sp.]